MKIMNYMTYCSSLNFLREFFIFFINIKTNNINEMISNGFRCLYILDINIINIY